MAGRLELLRSVIGESSFALRSRQGTPRRPSASRRDCGRGCGSPSPVTVSCTLQPTYLRLAAGRRQAKHRTVSTRASSSDNILKEDEVKDMSEEAAWKKREEESKASGDDAEEDKGIDSWKWTLNWSGITPEVYVGSCPRSTENVDTIIDSTGCNAILCLQSQGCFEALHIPYKEIRARAAQRGALWCHVAVRDFDHHDQARMLPEAVRVLATLRALDKKVYVHCTAGINRATLTVLGYLTFVLGHSQQEAHKMIKTARPIAHPYMDCWEMVRLRFLALRNDELTMMSKAIYEGRCAGGVHGNMDTDWKGAQQKLISFDMSRRVETDLATIEAVKMLYQAQTQALEDELAANQKRLEELLSLAVKGSQLEGEALEAAKLHATLATRDAELAAARHALESKEEEMLSLRSDLQAAAKRAEELAAANAELEMSRNVAQQMADSAKLVAASLEEAARKGGMQPPKPAGFASSSKPNSARRSGGNSKAAAGAPSGPSAASAASNPLRKQLAGVDRSLGERGLRASAILLEQAQAAEELLEMMSEEGPVPE